MATLSSVQATKINTTLASSNTAGYSPNPVNEQSGAIRAAYFSYYSGSNMSIGDIIELCQVPAGARIIGVTVGTNGLGGSCAGSIGDAGDDDRLVTSVTLSASAQADAAMRNDTGVTTENPALGYGYEYTADTVICIKLTAASANTGVIRGHIEYILN
jgi:hypothetical protein